MSARIPGGADLPAAGAVRALLAGARDFPEVDRVLLALAALRPMSGWEMARAVEAAAPGTLEGREGFLYPVLAGLERSGRVEADWVEEPGGRPRRVYRAAGAGDGAPSPAELPAAPWTASPRLRAAARDASRGIPGAFERESARAEILVHLECSAAAYAAMGLDAAAAEKAAARDLGDTWKIRTDLRRVHRDRPVVVFPRTLAERARALAIYDLGPLLAVFALLVLVRWQVVQAYNIPTKSMEPTLHGEEASPDFILVDKTVFLRRGPRRWDIIVFYPPRSAGRRGGAAGEGDGAPSAFVKRCTALGGETLDIREGDIHVDGRLARRPLDVEDSMMAPLYDLGRNLREAAAKSRLRPLGDFLFDWTWGMKTGGWSLREDRFVGEPGPEGEARLAYLRDVTNSYVDVDGAVRDHYDPVGDAEVRFLAEPLDPGASVGADLTEGEARHSLRIGPGGLTVRSGSSTWSSRLARAAPGRPIEVRFRNVDDRLTVRVDGEVVLREELPPRASVPERAAGAGVELVAEGGRAAFGAVRILRDIHYLRAGADSSWPRQIPAGHLFMMGDNTGSSNDSRSWGAVDEKDLVGIPFAVAYPPERAKLLK